MHIHPSSRGRRGALSVEEHARLRRVAQQRSLVAARTDNLAREVFDARIAILDELEAQGYVHIGERAWLEEVTTTAPRLGYAAWVRRSLGELGLGWAVDDTPGGQTVAGAWSDGWQVWRAELDPTALRLEQPGLTHPAFAAVDDEFEVRVAGDGTGPFPTHLVTVFEALHDLEYTLATVEPTDGYGPSSPIGVEATNAVEPGRWALRVISEYGSDFTCTISGTD